MIVYDLTPNIDENLAVFPGDVKFSREELLSFEKKHHLKLSSMRATFHLGAHADSSSHYHQNGLGIEKRNLAHFCGDAQVIRVATSPGKRISVNDLSNKIIQGSRILFSTGSFLNPNQWNSDFMSLSPELIEHLSGLGVCLVGLDTPSVDPENSKKLESHQALYRTGLSVLEGLVLSHVPEGIYTLVALPLPFVGADASPVRALLFDSPQLIPNEKWDLRRPKDL